MDPTVVAGIIGAGATLIAAIIAALERRARWRAERRQREAEVVQEELRGGGIGEVIIGYEQIVADLESTEKSSLTRHIRFELPEGKSPRSELKVALVLDRPITDYLQKKAADLQGFDPDGEFQIEVRDHPSGVRLPATSEVSGEKRDSIVTVIRLLNPLERARPVELEISYRNLDSSILWTDLWAKKPNEWFAFQTAPTETYSLEVIFPPQLPPWVGQIKSALTPDRWAEKDVHEGSDARKRLRLQARNLAALVPYRVVIDLA